MEQSYYKPPPTPDSSSTIAFIVGTLVVAVLLIWWFIAGTLVNHREMDMCIVEHIAGQRPDFVMKPMDEMTVSEQMLVYRAGTECGLDG